MLTSSTTRDGTDDTELDHCLQLDMLSWQASVPVNLTAKLLRGPDPVVMAEDTELNGHQQMQLRRAEVVEGKGLERSSTLMESQLSGLQVVKIGCSQFPQRQRR